MIASYHNHSTASDGAAPVAAIVARAVALGVDEVGISDHLTLRPDGSVPPWSMAPGRLTDYVALVRAAAAAAAGVTVRLGLEVDWFPGRAAEIGAALAGLPFDYLIGSCHEVGGFVTDAVPAHWERLSAAAREDVHRGYWEGVRSLASSGLFDLVGHLDLPKKFNQRPAADLSQLVGEALDAVRDAGLVVELNTSGWSMPCRDAYPSLELLRACAARGIPATLSADAHHPDHLLRDFDRGLERLREAGYRELARFAGRRRTMEPLEEVTAQHARLDRPGGCR